MKLWELCWKLGLLCWSSSFCHSEEALLSYSFVIPGNEHVQEDVMQGVFAKDSSTIAEEGQVIHVVVNNVSKDLQHAGCTPAENKNIPSEGKWIALIQRGVCKFETKIKNHIVHLNASAVIVYNNVGDSTNVAHVVQMEHTGSDYSSVSVGISKPDGEKLARIVDRSSKVMLNIKMKYSPQFIRKTSVFFVSIAILVLMLVSIMWLIYYYVQRFRYAHAKQTLANRLENAARKALTKLELKTIKTGDEETDSDWDPCAVCLDNYYAGEVTRILPCKHLFHKSCVDPWLLQHRSCPRCKLDILSVYGKRMQNTVSENHDIEENNSIEDHLPSIASINVVNSTSAAEIITIDTSYQVQRNLNISEIPVSCTASPNSSIYSHIQTPQTTTL